MTVRVERGGAIKKALYTQPFGSNENKIVRPIQAGAYLKMVRLWNFRSKIFVGYYFWTQF
jgi:hypothetical protein